MVLVTIDFTDSWIYIAEALTIVPKQLVL